MLRFFTFRIENNREITSLLHSKDRPVNGTNFRQMPHPPPSGRGDRKTHPIPSRERERERERERDGERAREREASAEYLAYVMRGPAEASSSLVIGKSNSFHSYILILALPVRVRPTTQAMHIAATSVLPSLLPSFGLSFFLPGRGRTRPRHHGGGNRGP